MSKAPFGTWTSKISSKMVAAEASPLADVIVDPIRSTIYHLELRPSGSTAIVNTTLQKDVVTNPYDASSLVHDYGGAAAIAYDGVIYFSNGPFTTLDQNERNRVYRFEDDVITPVTQEQPLYRYANFAVHPQAPHLLVSILEDHTQDPNEDVPQKVINVLCVINTITQTTSVLQGIDRTDYIHFFASPVFSPDSKKLAWQQWTLPDMPWEGGLIYVADVVNIEGSYGSISAFRVENAKKIAGQPSEISATYPSWTNNTTLLFTTDVSGFQNPWKYSASTGEVCPVFSQPVEQDFGGPAWTLGESPYALLDSEGKNALFTAFKDGYNILYLVDLVEGSSPYQINCPFTELDALRLIRPGEPSIVFLGKRSGLPKKDEAPGGVVTCTLSSSVAPAEATYFTLKNDGSGLAGLPDGYISPPCPDTLTVDGKPLYIVLYKPQNPDYAGSSIPGEQPPCVINVHGGPTSLEPQILNLTKQYYTSRGWAWMDVNYGGSSGYGRAYINLLAGQWGVKDVTDCYQAAKQTEGIDHDRVIIRGRSSGGYTALAAVSFGTKTYDGKFQYAAAGSISGISNLRLLGENTHKFELEYMNKLLGGSYKEIPKVWDEDRSPIFNAFLIRTPLLIVQGLKDTVVPPDQSQEIVDAIKKQPGGADRVSYDVFSDEGHIFKKAANIQKVTEDELCWYQKKVLNMKECDT